MAGESTAPAKTTAPTPASQESPQAQQDAPVQNQPAQQDTPVAAPKGQPSQEQQIARIVGEALAPISEALSKLNISDPEAAKSVDSAKADIDAITEKHAAEAKRWAVEKALLTSECVDTVGALAHVAMDSVELGDDGSLKGVDVEKLKADFPHLFKAAVQPAATVSTGSPAAGAPGTSVAKSIKDGIAQSLKK